MNLINLSLIFTYVLLLSIIYRFAQFFLCPLFTSSATEREVNAVDSENDKNLQNDSWRLFQLEKATCDPKHDFSKFGTGVCNYYNCPLLKSSAFKFISHIVLFSVQVTREHCWHSQRQRAMTQERHFCHSMINITHQTWWVCQC